MITRTGPIVEPWNTLLARLVIWDRLPVKFTSRVHGLKDGGGEDKWKQQQGLD